MLLNPSQTQQLLQHALQNEYAILAVNADSPAAIMDCLKAARDLDAPIIIETSLWQLKGYSFGADDAVLGLTRYLADLSILANHESFAHIPIIYHTDHIKGSETLHILTSGIKGVQIHHQDHSLKLHPSSISLDASELTEQENIDHICRLAETAKEARVHVTLEMESAVDDGITSEAETRRLLSAVEERHPGVLHLWAPGVGTEHGFTSSTGYESFHPSIIEKNVRLIREITGREFGIALHGSSGLTKQKLRDASRAGVTKVNWSSEGLLFRAKKAGEYYQNFGEKLTKSHKEWKPTAMDNGVQRFVSDAYIALVKERIETLGGAGQAERFMKNRYIDVST